MALVVPFLHMGYQLDRLYRDFPEISQLRHDPDPPCCKNFSRTCQVRSLLKRQLTFPKLNGSAWLMQRFVALFQLMVQTPEVWSLEIVSLKLKKNEIVIQGKQKKMSHKALEFWKRAPGKLAQIVWERWVTEDISVKTESVLRELAGVFR